MTRPPAPTRHVHPVRPRCTIVPPFILARLAETAPEPVAEGARTTLQLDEGLFRRRRGVAPSEDSSERPAMDDGTGPNRSVHDAQNATRLPGVLVRAEGAEPTGDVAVDEAYDGLGATWRLLHDALGRDSLDDNGLGLAASVHYGRNYLNAFWNGSQMVFGDGDGRLFNRFTASLDVIAHELAHGLTEYTAGLNYQGQSGALNEHVSDVFGAVTQQYALDQDADVADWLIGAALLGPDVNGVALRSMAAPGTAYDDPQLGRDPQPATMADYVDTTDDYGGVHINSGIPNKAFHALATRLGGPAWEAPLQIWYDVLTGDIRADCTFATFAHLTLAAARARFGARSVEADAVAAAWASVEVEPAPARQPTRTPAPSTGSDADATTRVVLRRTGGFAGLTRTASVELGDLPDVDAEAWRLLLAEQRLESMASAAPDERPTPDSYSYGVRCDAPATDVTLPEPAVPQDVRELFDRTLEA
ncbi:protealysin inhibitor emfourin [Propioniciclava soli]|uniref:Neutral metalloproteinase n=1 Tax=Propioniciclava soli TaxID=2775081 RepID=A0ABZ3C8D7_9ACTN|nr:protealysin inhibitor emfourin [Propioniciclava soli]